MRCGVERGSGVSTGSERGVVWMLVWRECELLVWGCETK